jgi:glycosyltransferase involved in cell wall biosynthesis
MASGVPVLVTAGTSCEEVVGDAGIAIGAHEAAPAWAAAAMELLGDAVAARRLAARGRARAEEFTWGRTAAETRAAYAAAEGG